jgi:uncharacterized protein YgiM (DUF1202 family)
MNAHTGSRKRRGSFLLVTMLVVIALVPQTSLADTDLAKGEAGVVAYANGDNVRLRSSPASMGRVLGSYAEGTRLTVVGGLESGSGLQWYRVEINGTTGYMAADFIANSDGFLASVSGSAVTTAAVRLRSGPSTADRIITTLANGTAVQLTGENVRGWFSVSAGSGKGYVYGAFLKAGSGNSGESGSATGGGTRYTLDRVHLRSGPGVSNRSITVLSVGTKLDFTGETQGSFAKVSSSAGTGWVAAQYIGPNAPSSSGGGGGSRQTKYTTDSVNLRSGASTTYRSLGILPVGAKLDLTGESANGFVEAATSYGTGWVYADYIGDSAPVEAETAYTNDSVSLRSGPGSNTAKIATLSTGAKLALTGIERDGYKEVSSNAGKGWVAASYISDVAPQHEAGTRYTIDSVNLRRGPQASSAVIRVVPNRTSIRFTGTVVNNFGKVATSFGDGWISIDYFRKMQPPAASGSLVVWPVKGGEWYVSQGYNGSSHQNTSQHWQYYYSFDLKRSSGDTAWQPVYAPVDGTIRWIDESTGGMSIYMGDDLAFAMFHVIWDDDIREGQSISQGQYLGVIAPADSAGNGGSPHLHITAWTTSDGGIWSRRAQPFTGRFAIQGASFPATGAGNDYLRYEFTP